MLVWRLVTEDWAEGVGAREGGSELVSGMDIIAVGVRVAEQRNHGMQKPLDSFPHSTRAVIPTINDLRGVFWFL